MLKSDLKKTLATALLFTGWRPRRTIVICSWDGEEFGLLGSTEWTEVCLEVFNHLTYLLHMIYTI